MRRHDAADAEVMSQQTAGDMHTVHTANEKSVWKFNKDFAPGKHTAASLVVFTPSGDAAVRKIQKLQIQLLMDWHDTIVGNVFTVVRTISCFTGRSINS